MLTKSDEINLHCEPRATKKAVHILGLRKRSPPRIGLTRTGAGLYGRMNVNFRLVKDRRDGDGDALYEDCRA